MRFFKNVFHKETIKQKPSPSMCTYCGASPFHCNGSHSEDCPRFVPHVVISPQEVKDAYYNKQQIPTLKSYKVLIKENNHQRTFITHSTSLAGAFQYLTKLFKERNEDFTIVRIEPTEEK
jgi:hypothetical protein